MTYKKSSAVPGKSGSQQGNKYGAKPFWWNPVTGAKVDSKLHEHCIYWDSILEFNVYCELRKLYPATAIFRQHPIFVKPASAHYPERVWACDFRVQTAPAEHLNIEVKGAWILKDSAALSDFTKTLQFLDLHNPPDYNRLIIVSDKQFKLDKQWQTLQLPQLKELLLKSS